MYFLDEEKKFPSLLGEGNSMYLGYLVAEIKSDKDLYEFMKEKGYSNNFFDVKLCDQRLQIWAAVPDDSNLLHNNPEKTYNLLIEYKSDFIDRGSYNQEAFNLSEKPEDICLTGVFTTMWLPTQKKTNEIRYKFSDGMISQIQEYEEKSGKVSITETYF